MSYKGVADISLVSERISDVVKPWAEQIPDHPALVEAEHVWTYRELAIQTLNMQVWLVDWGVRPGDRVMIVCENGRAFVAILLALAELDAWPVLVNARLSGREVDQIRDHCGARLVIYTAGASPKAAQHAKRHGAEIVYRQDLGEIGVGPLNEHVEPEPVETDIGARAAALIYTSGTTGQPKGVMLSHRNLLFVATVSARIRSLTPDDSLYGVLPMSHAVGLSVVLLGTLFSGGTVHLSARFDPMELFSTLQKGELTVLLGTPSMFSMLLDYAEMKRLPTLRFPRLRIISSSGAPLQMTTKSAVERAFGMPLHNGYGITECSPNIAQTSVEAPRSDTSVGRILPGVEIRIVRPNGDRVADGEVGELFVRGPNIMKGYYRAPEESAAAVDSQGWFRTRDLVRMEDDHLFIVGRAKELILHFGLNVYPEEVEALLNTHPAVLRSAVVGRPVDGAAGGEEVIAYVQLTPGTPLEAGELASYAAHHLAPYKRPAQIVFVSAMPLTLTGKVMKDKLVAAHSSRVAS